MAKATKQQQCGIGSVFGVEQGDRKYCLGQVLDMMLPNVVSCVFYDLRFRHGFKPPAFDLPFDKIISAMATTPEKLDSGKWKVLGMNRLQLDRQFWPNEQYRDLEWVGAKTYGSRIVEKFLEAYFGVIPWDSYADPNYFDKLLFFEHRKPRSPKFKSNS